MENIADKSGMDKFFGVLIICSYPEMNISKTEWLWQKIYLYFKLFFTGDRCLLLLLFLFF